VDAHLVPTFPKTLYQLPSGCWDWHRLFYYFFQLGRQDPALGVGRSITRGATSASGVCTVTALPLVGSSRRCAAGAPETLLVVLAARLQARIVSGSIVLPLLLFLPRYQSGLPAKDRIDNCQLQGRATQSHYRHRTGPASDQVPDFLHDQSLGFHCPRHSHSRGSWSRSSRRFSGLDNHRGRVHRPNV